MFKFSFGLCLLTLEEPKINGEITRTLCIMTLQPIDASLCRKVGETQSHLLFFFPSSQRALCLSFDFAWAFSFSVEDNLIQLLRETKLKGNTKIIWRNTVKAITWSLWLERNYLIYHDRDRFYRFAKFQCS